MVYGFIAITVLPVIFGIYAVFISMIAVGFALILSGFAVMFSPIFMAIVPGLIYNPLSIGSSLIASIGVILIGIAFIWIFWALIKLLTHFVSFAYKRMFGVGGTL